MTSKITYGITIIAFAALCFIGCKKQDYSFGPITAPSNLSLSATIQGATTNAPFGDSTAKVSFQIAATNAIAYKVYFGEGDSLLTEQNSFSFQYSQTPNAANTFNVTVNAIGTGGAISTVTKQISLYYKYQLDTAIISALTNNASKVWKIASGVGGHFGVGPATDFTPDYFAASANLYSATCAYNTLVTFTKTGANSISVKVNNSGSSYLIGASVSFYGQSGAEGCFAITTGAYPLSFSGATSGSTASNSTGVQFNVPGNGILDFGTGANNYEILSITSGILKLRNIGIDGNAWYQIFQPQ